LPWCLHFSTFVQRQFFPWAAHCAIEMIPNTSCYIYKLYSMLHQHAKHGDI
jgi:hypothetical protein